MDLHQRGTRAIKTIASNLPALEWHIRYIRRKFVDHSRIHRREITVYVASLFSLTWHIVADSPTYGLVPLSISNIPRNESNFSRDERLKYWSRARRSRERFVRQLLPVNSFSGEVKNQIESLDGRYPGKVSFEPTRRTNNIGRCPFPPSSVEKQLFARSLKKKSRVCTFLIKFRNVGRRCATASRPRGGLENFQEFNWSPGILAADPGLGPFAD